MARQDNKLDLSVRVPKSWQLTFVLTLLASQVISNGVMIWGMVAVDGYVSSGTWVISLTMWLYPLLFLVPAYIFASSQARNFLSRLFLALIVSSIAVFIYQIVDTLFESYREITHYAVSGSGLWSAFGDQWIVMSVIFVLFIITIVYLSRRKRTKA